MSKIAVSKPENLPKVTVTKTPGIISSNRYDLHGGDINVTYGVAGAGQTIPKVFRLQLIQNFCR
jgi:hypothetical protein